MDSSDFLDRVMQHVPSGPVASYHFDCWNFANRPTNEGLGMLPESGIDPDKFIARVMDVDAYVGNLDHVLACRSIADEQYQPPKQVRFYEKINVPLVAKVQMELVLTDLGERDGYRVAAWHMLERETEALNKKEAARCHYNLGAWLVRENMAAYALASAPRKEDLGFVKFKALTKGADAMAPKVFKATIGGMLAWAKR